MFVCTDVSGLRIQPSHENSSKLRQLSREGQLVCPECRKRVQYCHGIYKQPYFRHHKVECTYLYHEPETEEHRNGKWAIYEWLQKVYPDSTVELEYRIEETNQRSDVIVLHPNGERWAFEFQCYRISGQTWLERHALYKEAGVVDFWIVGETVHTFGKTNKETDSVKHLLCDLERAIFTHTKRLDYLFTPENTLLTLIDEGNTYMYGPECENRSSLSGRIVDLVEGLDYPLSVSFVKDYQLWSPALARELQARLDYEMHLLREQEERAARELANRKAARLRFKATFAERSTFTSEMTQREKQLFIELCTRHGFNSDNFPGVLHVHVYHAALIDTPPQLWQLWIYDTYIYRRRNKKLWLPNIKDAMSDILRTRKSVPGMGHWSFSIWEYFEVLSNLGITQQISLKNSNYHLIGVDTLPMFNLRRDNVLINLCLSGTVNQHEVKQEAREVLEAFRKEIRKERGTLVATRRGTVTTNEFSKGFTCSNCGETFQFRPTRCGECGFVP